MGEYKVFFRVKASVNDDISINKKAADFVVIGKGIFEDFDNQGFETGKLFD